MHYYLLMPVILPHHVCYCYTGTHSFGAGLRLRQILGAGLEARLTSQSHVIQDIIELHAQWVKSGCNGLEIITILGALIPDSLDNARIEKPGVFENIFDDFANNNVKIIALNEFKPFKTEGLEKAYFELSARDDEGLIGGLERIFKSLGFKIPNDPFRIQDLLKESLGKDRSKLEISYLMLEWLEVEVMQSWDEELLQKFINQVGSVDVIPDWCKQRAQMQRSRGREVIVGKIYDQVLNRLSKVAPSNLPVLILGPSGTGKELIARRIHYTSSRWMNKLVTESCANFPDQLFEAEMFGSLPGAFTGALAKKGLVSDLNGGTLFLDEIGELSKSAQGKLLRFLQDGTYRKLGATENEPKVDVRIIAATNEDLYAKVRRGEFRADLWHRLCGEILTPPALQGQDESIRRIATHQAILLYDSDPILIERRKSAKHPLRLDPTQIDALLNYSWPGNVRELRQAIHRHLVTERSMAEIVDEMIQREQNWLKANTGILPDEPEPFIVREPMNTQDLVNAYAAWARKRWPNETQESLSLMLGSSVKTLRRRVQNSSKKSS